MSSDLTALTSRRSPFRVVLHQEQEGVYAFAYDDETSSSLVRNDLYDSLEDAKRFCEQDYGIPISAWHPIAR